jgi:hypothetical protein
MTKGTQNNTLYSNEETQQSASSDNTKGKNEYSYPEQSKHFLTDENFAKLRQMQHEIYEQYEVSLPIRKLVNSLITDGNLNQLKLQLTKKLGI